jgi:hypothetical protein
MTAHIKMLNVKQLYESMTRFRSPFAKICATVGAFSGFFSVNGYYLKKNCNYFLDIAEDEIKIAGNIVVNNDGININDQIIIDDNGIKIGIEKQNNKLNKTNQKLTRFKMTMLDYLIIKNAPYSVNFLTGTIIGSVSGYIYGMYFPVTIPLTVTYSVITNIINDN